MLDKFCRMAKHNKNDLLQKFKEKVIGKLFGYPERDDADSDDTGSEHSVDEDVNHSVVFSSSSVLSGLETEVREQQVRMYGAQCCPTGSKPGGHANEPVHMVGSSSYLSDDEASDICVNTRKRKRKRRTNPSQENGQTTSSSSHSLVNTQSPHTSTCQSQPSGSGLTKNQRRKLKKKRRDKEKRTESTEFTFDSSMNNSRSEIERQNSLEEYQSRKKLVCEFLEAVETPCREHETSKIQLTTKVLEQTDPESKKEVMLLYSVISTLIHGGQQRSLQKINDFKKNTILNADMRDFVIQTLEIWLNEMKEK